MFQITQDSIIINTFEDLSDFQDQFSIFKTGVYLLSIEVLKKLKSISQNDESFLQQVYYFYVNLFGEIFIRVDNFSDEIDTSKITDELNGKILRINIASANPTSLLLQRN